MLKGIRPRLMELGKIKIGRKEEKVRTSQGGNTWRAPEKLDHFLVTTLERDAKGDLRADAELMTSLASAHQSADGKLREIPIALLSDDVDEVLVASHCLYTKRSLGARCDGTNVTWHVDAQGKDLPEPVTKPCNGEHETKGWKVHATLNCVIASQDARWGGVYKFRTTSVISLEQLYGTLLHIQQLTGGVLQGIPLRLVVRPLQVSPEGKTTTVYVVHVELRGQDLSAIQQQAAQFAQLRVTNAKQIQASRREYLALLKAPGEAEERVEQEDIATEFHPGPDNHTPPHDPETGVVIEPPAGREPGDDSDETPAPAESTKPAEVTTFAKPDGPEAPNHSALIAKIKSAPNIEALKSLHPELKGQLAGVPKEQVHPLRTAYNERSAELAKGAA